MGLMRKSAKLPKIVTFESSTYLVF